MKKSFKIGMVAVVLSILVGCGNLANKVDNNTLVVNKDLSILDISLEDYSSNDYQLEQLEQYINDEIQAYNDSTGDKSIKLKSYNEDNAFVRISVQYKGIDDYNAFNGTEYTIQPIEEADLSQTDNFLVAEDKSAATAADVKKSKEAKVLTISEAMDVRIKGKTLYYNSEVTENEDGSFTVSGDKAAIIIFQ